MELKEQTKRFYKFTFEELAEKLGLKGKHLDYDDKDDKGKKSKTLTIITEE